MPDDSLDTTPLQAALDRALVAARESMEADGFEVATIIVVADARHPAAPPYARSAVAFPIGAWSKHAELLREGADIFERAGRATLDGRLEPPSQN